MKALLKRMLKPFYRATKKVLHPVATRIRGPLSQILYPPEFEEIFQNLEQITKNLNGYIDQSDQMLLAMFQTLHLPPAIPTTNQPNPVNLGNGRILAKHPVASCVLLDANDLRETPAILFNEYQPHVTEALRRIVRPGDCCINLGAGIGFHTLTMTATSGASCLTVEIDPHKSALLHDSLIAARLSEVCAAFHPNQGATAAEAIRWISTKLSSRNPDVVRIGSGFDCTALQTIMPAWSAVGTRFVLSTKAGWMIAKELTGYSTWRIADDGSLFRASLAELEELGRTGEVHFLAAKELT